MSSSVELWFWTVVLVTRTNFKTGTFISLWCFANILLEIAFTGCEGVGCWSYSYLSPFNVTCPDLSSPILACPYPSWPVLTCNGLYWPVPACSDLSWPFWFLMTKFVPGDNFWWQGLFRVTKFGDKVCSGWRFLVTRFVPGDEFWWRGLFRVTFFGDEVCSGWRVLVTTSTRNFIKIEIFGVKKIFFGIFTIILGVT